VAEKPHDAVVKFDTTKASRGSPCDSTALVNPCVSWYCFIYEVYMYMYCAKTYLDM